MAALLEQGVDFDCVICDNDEMALGVIEALEAAGWDPGAAPIVSVDHTAEGAAALESGKLYMTVDQNPEDQARAAVAAAVNLARGRAYDDGLRELLGNDCMLVSMELHLDASIDKLDNLAMNVQLDKEKHKG